MYFMFQKLIVVKNFRIYLNDLHIHEYKQYVILSMLITEVTICSVFLMHVWHIQAKTTHIFFLSWLEKCEKMYMHLLFESKRKSINYFTYSTSINWMLTMCQAGAVLDSEVAHLPHPPWAPLMEILHQVLLVVIIKRNIRIANICWVFTISQALLGVFHSFNL